ncbi:dihydrolipoamide acetyltransferase family protein [Salicibibacter kimchii]|uniref:Dihydrolipoamide acetyltransferase component of pyruvate dehydrogenase complex n=1 Tax=Salicibibacter kimchii TaxID=2099786 RepID=A0A345BWK6_9BACI|nr:dihydrolipoamide acetyltransferase family protein [Salicibibacter kimchii]AXF55337.1 2-oxo acid dehydrogenase subunit E2 [Salicibibacter kimchii]
MIKEFKLPDIGEGLQEAEVVTWFVKKGDKVKENENIAEVQTDKAVVEITTPYSGVVHERGGEEGENIKVGETLISIETESEGVNELKRETEQSYVEEEKEASNAPARRVKAAPTVRKLARQLGVTISEVTPTGRGGKIIADDVRLHAEGLTDKSNEAPDPSTSTHSEPIKGVRKKIFENMTHSMSEIPQCTGMDEVDVSRLSEFRGLLKNEMQNGTLTYLPFIVKAVAFALRENPRFNGRVDKENMLFHYQADIHIGVATATEDGLVVPVLKSADNLSVEEIARSIEDLSTRARAKKLKSDELSGSTFTISNTGKRGGFFATPIINPPEVAILGVHSITRKPVVKDEEIQIGDVMGMSITFDHRVIDGEHSAQFMSTLEAYLEKPELFIFKGK